ncbi:hypothetical protein A3715_11290 [Oleiphilus sp. HI0009]|nr:hypothetical protein A3715_11290 [Oleiphilus sp. HI0009]
MNQGKLAMNGLKKKVYNATKVMSYESGLVHILILVVLMIVGLVGGAYSETVTHKLMWCIPFASAGIMSLLYVWSTSGEASVENILDEIENAIRKAKRKSGE